MKCDNNKISRKKIVVFCLNQLPKNIQFVIKVLIDVPGVLVDISDKASKDPQVKIFCHYKRKVKF